MGWLDRGGGEEEGRGGRGRMSAGRGGRVGWIRGGESVEGGADGVWGWEKAVDAVGMARYGYGYN